MNKFKYINNSGKEKSFKCIHIPLDIYGCDVRILMPKETKMYNKEMGYISNPEGGNTVNFLNQNSSVGIFLEGKSTPVVAHELLHAVQMIMHHIGHNHAAGDADEPSAYLLTYLLNEYEKGLKLYNKKK